VPFDLPRFTQDLVARLKPWLPPGVRLHAVADGVSLDGDGNASVTIYVSDLFARAPHEEAAVRAAHQILDAVQDFVSHEMGEPWPPVEGEAPRHLAVPVAEARDGLVELWYGDAGEPALALTPLRLDEYAGG
jgi:hypothetical protein